ncbi:dethiobiotin synthase [Tumidithrix elongata RA019]|uniref:ATP-dependent dethiobiotin synthetase BioD n=1 Tax=Tumidithrix elongata BACA0141 TaxID=2716417 RepID=A0AAW9Q0W9_9CYAN|nr:dethiobiotin synthase [Tumidithrix elongata RA019]
MQPLLIVGTDTGVGKTVLTSSLAAYWQTHRSSQTLGIYKPIQSGEGDREFFQRTFSLSQTLEEITPIYFETPIAPAIAAVQEGKSIDLGKIWQQFQTLQQQKQCLLVESLGGLGSPITYEYTVADLASDWRIATVLVVPVRLGAIGQAVANVALATLKKIDLKGIVLSCAQPCSSQDIENFAAIDLIQSLTYVPVLGVLPHLSDPSDLSKLAHLASGLELEVLGF